MPPLPDEHAANSKVQRTVTPIALKGFLVAPAKVDLAARSNVLIGELSAGAGAQSTPPGGAAKEPAAWARRVHRDGR